MMLLLVVVNVKKMHGHIQERYTADGNYVLSYINYNQIAGKCMGYTNIIQHSGKALLLYKIHRSEMFDIVFCAILCLFVKL